MGVPTQAQEVANSAQANKRLNYVINNFDELFRSDYPLFWTIIHNAADEAASCKSIRATADFLSLARVKKGNVEFDEFFGEFIEIRLISKDATCFLDALLATDEASRNKIMKDLHYPILMEISEVEKILDKYKNDEKYKKVIKLYFNQDN